jgi:uncharacterized protein YjiS (DUF1127 family)
MSAHIADSEFNYRLPSLSYIDASWEEAELRGAASKALPAPASGLAGWLAARIAALRIWHRNNQAAMELGAMSDYELMDMGINRSDLHRLFDPTLNADLRQRG